LNLTLTPAQYRKLIELAYLGEWMINAHHDPDFQDDEATSVMQKLLGAHPLPEVGKDDETGDYFMKTDWVERLYDLHILDDINRDDDLLELRPLEDRYRDELEEHGIERLEIPSF
jgi:hypothetical protein